MEPLVEKKIEKAICISISIFYAQLGWYNLIINGILPFVGKTDKVQDYFLSLGQNRGEHIKLFLTTSESEAEKIASKADAWFKRFIMQQPVNKYKGLILKNRIFCDFEPNTVHYGIYDGFGITPLDFAQLQRELTKLLILIFKENGNETITSLIEIMIGLFAHFQDSINLNNNDTAELFKSLLSAEKRKHTTLAVKRAEFINQKNFEENKESIVNFLRSKHANSNGLGLSYKKWGYIVRNYKSWSKNSVENEHHYLVTSLCDTFAFTERISAYYLFVNALKHR